MDSLEYFKKSFFAVDGLWFIMVEEESSFEYALELDKRVWKIMAKIQARLAMKLGKDFFESLRLKWESEGYKYRLEKYSVIIEQCPWWEIMKSSGRENTAGRVGAAICPVLYNEWAKEYNAPYAITFETSMCQGEKVCTLHFEKSVK
ncbi:MAG: DUF6125 family protein [Candidatus Methanofastidiosia archaeon]